MDNYKIASFSFQELDYEGAVRFYFEAGRQELTKAVKISNKTKVEDLLPILVEKFNLQKVGCRYTLFVVHEIGECRPFNQAESSISLCHVRFGKCLCEQHHRSNPTYMTCNIDCLIVLLLVKGDCY